MYWEEMSFLRCNWWSYYNSWSKRNGNFACKKFFEMTPKVRFQELWRKGYYFQCLFPGASQSTGKHSDGKYQKDFSCKNTSHDKYPTKKHILVCHEHRGNKENEQLLLDYKNRCIMKQTKLPAFSRDLKLIFHMNQQQPSDYKHLQSNQELAISTLQTTKVNKQNYCFMILVAVIWCPDMGNSTITELHLDRFFLIFTVFQNIY